MQTMMHEVSVSFARTFGEKAAVARFRVLSQKPPVTEVVVAFNQLDTVAASQGKLVGATSLELICSRGQERIAKRWSVYGAQHLRTTRSRSPGRTFSVWDLAAMAALDGEDGKREE